MTLQLTSTAFKHGDPIPSQYSCDGVDISPPLAWQNIPENTASFVLIIDDPDAPVGIWDHWLLFNIPAKTTSLAENISALPEGTKVGQNSWGNNTYGGPCPPKGKHRYFFKLYALDTTLDLEEGATKATLETAIHGHVLAEAELMGTYDRS